MAASLTAMAAAQGGEEQVKEDASPKRLNVLFIAVDDLRPELGCYGVAEADSPHMDAFAATAATFERHFVQAPSCGPSRAALLTGLSPSTSGRFQNDALYGRSALLQEQQPGAQSMPELFRRGGYRTVDIGKISHTPDGRVFAYDGSGDGRHELPHAWDELATPFGDWGRGWGAFFAYAGGHHREDGGSRRSLTEFSVQGDEDLPDGLMALAAATKLKELASREEPFFLGVGFFKPHLPFVAPEQDRRAFQDLDLAPVEATPLPPVFGSGSGEFRGYRTAANPEQRASLPLDRASALEARRAYYACVRYVDRQVGVVLKALDDNGLFDSTVVVLWGDHGWHLGESGVWGKHTLVDRSLHSVLMIRAPGVTEPGQRIAGLAASIDLYPTLVELCGLGAESVHRPLDGVSLRPLLAREAKTVRRSVRSFWGDRATVRTADYRLLAKRIKGGGWGHVQLYRTADGPDPIRSAAEEEPSVVKELLGQLRAQ